MRQDAYQWSVLRTDESVMFAAPTQSPKLSQEVVRLPGWPVMAPPVWPCARYMSTVTVCRVFTGKSMGSDTASAPFGMIMSGLPLNDTDLVDPCSMALVPSWSSTGREMATFVMDRSVSPNVLETRRRICCAGWVTRKV